jgi:hypothetical protein
VTLSNVPAVGAPDAVRTNGFTYTGSENDLTPTSALEADFCNLQTPLSFTVSRNSSSPSLYGRIFEAGVTESAGAPAGILADVGYGPSGTDPRTNNAWMFYPASFHSQVGTNDQFVGGFQAPNVLTTTNFSYTFRFSQDNGLKWTYCDVGGAGSDPGLIFETTSLGVMTVIP